MRRVGTVVPALCAVLVLGTAACGSRGDDPEPGPPSTSVVRSGPAPALPSAVGARDDLDGLRCVHDSRGTWAASGTLHNTTARKADYAVSVYVVRTMTGTVVGQASRVWRVGAGDTRKVSLSRVYSATATAGLQCVPHITREVSG